MDRSRQAVPWETTAARPRGGKVRSGTGGGVAYLFADERAGDDDGDVHARALRGGEEAGDGAVAVRLIRGRAGVFCRWSCARSSRQGFGSRRSRRGTHRHRGLVERFEHGVRGFFIRGSLRALRALPARSEAGDPNPIEPFPFLRGPRKKSHGHRFQLSRRFVCCSHRVMYEHLVWISVEHRVQVFGSSTAPFLDSRATLVVPRRAQRARSPEREGAHVPLRTARTTANMASKISKMMDRTGKTSIFDHGKVRLAKRRKCSDTQPVAHALA